ncbi:hypothetical protein SLA2020_315340 [Shorea laevis]
MNSSSPTQSPNDPGGKTCFLLPPKINSAGIWENTDSPSVIFSYSLPLLELQIFVLFICSHTIHFFFKRIGLRSLVSQIVAGLMLGPTLLGKVESLKISEFFSPGNPREVLDTTANFGFSIFLFLMGVKTDMGMAFRAARRATVIGIASVLFPLIIALTYHMATASPHQTRGIKLEHMAVITVSSFTSFPVIACLLDELMILNSELGRLALSSAIVADFCGIFLICVVIFSRIWDHSKTSAIKNTAGTISFTFVAIFILRPIMVWMVRRTPEGKPVKDTYIHTVVLMALASALYTNYFDHTPLFGAFVFGLVVPDGPPLGSILVEKFECFVTGVFFPIYVVTTTLRADPGRTMIDVAEEKLDKFNIIVIVLTFLGKLASSFLPSLFCKMPWKDALALALIMSSKGVVELSHFSILKDKKVMRKRAFAVAVIGILLNSAIVPLLVKLLYDPFSRKYAGYQKRNIMYLKRNAEFRILVCVHRPENVSAFIDLLNATGPTKQSPNVVYVLHLIELIGRASPVFIAHQRKETRVSDRYFESVILAFNQYEQRSWGLVTVNPFTAISPTKLMHEDICTLALDKQTSFLLLPFHRKWAIDGSIESESLMIRNLNCSVLERAPCSVGILIDRGVVGRLTSRRTSTWSATPTYSVGIVFFGGKDDREALALAKRMANDPKVSLTVIHFVSKDDNKGIMDHLLDAEVLRNVKKDNSMYMEEEVKDGPQTALILRSIVDGYDLLIVGRRQGIDSVQTSGLSEWSEYPELGIIGDLLASPDFESRTSVLVVQQQQYTDVEYQSVNYECEKI